MESVKKNTSEKERFQMNKYLKCDAHFREHVLSVSFQNMLSDKTQPNTH